MTIDEAIKHAEEVADGHDRIKQIKAVTLEECKCASEHRKLAEWLKELKQLREQTDGDLISRDFMKKLGATCIATRNEKGELVAISSIDNLQSTEKKAEQVELEGDGYYDGELVFDFGKCPNCGWDFEEGDKDWEQPYCCHCGQRLHWFDKESEEE